MKWGRMAKVVIVSHLCGIGGLGKLGDWGRGSFEWQNSGYSIFIQTKERECGGEGCFWGGWELGLNTGLSR